MTEPVAQNHVRLHPPRDQKGDALDTSGYVNEELIDEDGYPTQAALDRLRSFHGTAEDMVAYVRSLMHNGKSTLEDYVDDYGRDEKRLTLVTGGWSGCEEVISALEGTIFKMLFWESSHRGGKHTFTFSPQQLAMVLIWGDPAAVPFHPDQKDTHDED